MFLVINACGGQILKSSIKNSSEDSKPQNCPKTGSKPAQNRPKIGSKTQKSLKYFLVDGGF
jgi:hypothetical protein